MASPDVRDRPDDKLFERRPVEISKLLEVEANLAHPVLAKLGQQGSLLLPFSQQVDHEFSATDGKACQRGFSCSSALVGVSVGAIADDAGSPHSWGVPGHLLEQSHQLPAVGALLRVGSRGDVLLDAGAGGLGLVFGHQAAPRDAASAFLSMTIWPAWYRSC